MTYEEWVGLVPKQIRDDALWRLEAYRLGLFVADLGWYDMTRLTKDSMMRELADQLYRAVGSISANIAEGYSHRSNKEKARFYEYALGSARESRDWYFKARHGLGPAVVEHRIDLLTRIIRLLITMVPEQRLRSVKEVDGDYEVGLHSRENIPFDPIDP
ncbi:MAG: four helix bundle protein [Caldilineaceae bacterium]|mgnify:CR=1 FL=1|nr:four helix bundle protein [Caldilineaceae bacterium]